MIILRELCVSWCVCFCMCVILLAKYNNINSDVFVLMCNFVWQKMITLTVLCVCVILCGKR